jgi:hypothetical protein
MTAGVAGERRIVRAARVVVRIGAVLLLIVAAIVLAVGIGEYPGITRPALRYMLTEVLPLTAVAGLNFAAFGGDAPVSEWRRALALAASAGLLAVSIPDFRQGAPPVTLAVTALAAILTAAALAIEIVQRRERR